MYVFLIGGGRGITSQLYSRLFLLELLAHYYNRANILKALQHCKIIASLQQCKKLAAPYSIAKILEPTVHTYRTQTNYRTQKEKRNGMLCAHRGAVHTYRPQTNYRTQKEKKKWLYVPTVGLELFGEGDSYVRLWLQCV